MTKVICDECETVAHCLKNGCVPKQPAPVQQEPVALGYMNAGHVHEMQQGRLLYGYVYSKEGAGVSVAVYTSPPTLSLCQRTPLTDEEIEQIWRLVQASDFHDCVQPFARAIEAKLKEKNED